MFNPTFWAVTQPLGQNNPIAGFIHILPSAGLYLTQPFLPTNAHHGVIHRCLYFFVKKDTYQANMQKHRYIYTYTNEHLQPVLNAED